MNVKIRFENSAHRRWRGINIEPPKKKRKESGLLREKRQCFSVGFGHLWACQQNKVKNDLTHDKRIYSPPPTSLEQFSRLINGTDAISIRADVTASAADIRNLKRSRNSIDEEKEKKEKRRKTKNLTGKTNEWSAIAVSSLERRSGCSGSHRSGIARCGRFAGRGRGIARRSTIVAYKPINQNRTPNNQ